MPDQKRDPFADYVVASDDPFASYAVDAPQSDRIPYDPSKRASQKPAAAEDFTDAPSRGWPAKIGDAFGDLASFARGAAKGAAHTALDIGQLAINAGMVPGHLPGVTNPAIELGREATAYRDGDIAERIGGATETALELAAPAMDAARLGVVGARAVPGMVRSAGGVGPLAFDAATHLVPGGGYLRAARKMLALTLDAAGKAAPKVESEAAKTGTKVASKMVPLSMEDYKSAMAARRAALGNPRLVKPQTTEDAWSAVLEDVRKADSTRSVELPPPAELPAGYSPRTSAPKAKSTPKTEAKQAPKHQTEPTIEQPAKRAYFLRSPEEIADIKASRMADPVEYSDEVTRASLPDSWKTHTDQDLFPMSGVDEKALTASLREELKSRGVSVGEALSIISKNKQLPTDVRFNLIRSLGGGAR